MSSAKSIETSLQNQEDGPFGIELTCSQLTLALFSKSWVTNQDGHTLQCECRSEFWLFLGYCVYDIEYENQFTKIAYCKPDYALHLLKVMQC